MSHRLEYVSPSGEEITLDPMAHEGPFFLMTGIEGMMANQAELIMRESPGQRGGSAVDVSVGRRALAVQVAILANSSNELWELREKMISAMALEPRSTVGPVPMGNLRLVRSGMPTLEMRCVPVNSPEEVKKIGAKTLVVDIEFHAPSPYWRETKARSSILETDGGFEFPLEFPWESIANNVEATVENKGSVSTPIVARMYGEFENGRLHNLTYGEVIEFNGLVASGDHVEIITEFGNKSVTLVRSDGTRENAMGSVDLSTTTFWTLRRGSNTIRWEADQNPSGRADLSWYTLRGGV